MVKRARVGEASLAQTSALRGESTVIRLLRCSGWAAGKLTDVDGKLVTLRFAKDVRGQVWRGSTFVGMHVS